ncbi:DUF4349 domain-containing protein [Apibacter muscae]|uniref:DUF4349 domain-containing protein n=1 Tax=Apibacter muscae TaxID=2509004 RepID=A0A563D8N2_9FLAO|nr:DUF4349 domain-containing protein [Apibacter muscae]TWP26540.1 DUF4349 domain-containing protein [Apibacter muscae]
MKKFIFPILLAIGLISCEQKRFKDSTLDESIESIAIESTLKQTNKQFIHKSHIDGEVKDVLKSTLNIEKSVIDLGGYITTSKINSELKSKTIEPISADSAKEIKIFKTVAEIHVNVPQIYLSQFLANVNAEIEYLNTRVIEATDITYQGQELSLDEKRLIQTQKKLDTVNIPNKNKQRLIKQQDHIQYNLDHTKLAQAILSDKIKFSTVSINLIGKDTFQENIVPNTDHYQLYNNNHLFYRLKTAFVSGWIILQTIIVTLCYLWPIVILALIGFIIYKKYKNKLEKVNKMSK